MRAHHRIALAAIALGLGVGLGARAEEDPRARAETAIQNGLKWLAARQAADGPETGSWETVEPRYRTAVASLAGLAFLANGYLPGEGPYGQVIDRVMAHVKPSMAADGYLGQGDRSGMYIHAICTLFGLSYLGMSPERATETELAEWCRKSLGVILEAQKVSRPDFARGGWRYTPYTDESDVSVTSWQLLVLHAARQCGYAVDDESLDAAIRFINGAFVEQAAAEAKDAATAGFVYRPGVSQAPEPSVTGAALFIKSLIERRADGRVMKSLDLLKRYPPSWGGQQYGGYFFFSAFYMTQGMFQIGGTAWDDYMAAMRSLLIEHQAADGSWPYPPDDMRQSLLAGPAYPTAMAVLILSLEKQYLPMYQREMRFY